MQIIRTIVWIVITAILVTFMAMNWTTVPVNFWPLADGNYLHFEWPVGVIALVFFLLGLLPTWLLLRATRWRLNRRVASLENTVRTTSTAPATATIPPADSTLAPVPPTTITNEPRPDLT